MLKAHPAVWSFRLGDVTNGNFEILINDKAVIDEPVKALKSVWAEAMEAQLADEVVTA